MEVNGFENYLIYKDGRVFSKKRKKFLKSHPNNYGYIRIILCKDGKPNNFLIHRLIAEHYIANPNNYLEVDHIDRDRKNNSIDNLRWVTKTMNSQNTGLFKTNKLGISNIYQTEKGYRFKIIRNGNKHEKNFKTLEDSIKYKEEYLNQLERPTTKS